MIIGVNTSSLVKCGRLGVKNCGRWEIGGQKLWEVGDGHPCVTPPPSSYTPSSVENIAIPIVRATGTISQNF